MMPQSILHSYNTWSFWFMYLFIYYLFIYFLFLFLFIYLFIYFLFIFFWGGGVGEFKYFLQSWKCSTNDVKTKNQLLIATNKTITYPNYTK